MSNIKLLKVATAADFAAERDAERDALMERIKRANPKTLLCVVEEDDDTVVILCDKRINDHHANWILDRAKAALHQDE